MRFIHFILFLICVFSTSALWALPGSVENNAYKVTLSETMPGLDDQTSLQAPPTITATVLDKFRSTQSVFPLNFFAIHQYFLNNNTLNLLGRLNRSNSPGGPRFCFLQIDLSNQADSRQFQPLKRYSFSPDNNFLLGVFAGQGHGDSIGFIRLSQSPAQIGWLYAEDGAVNLLKGQVPDIGSSLVLKEPVGWSADSRTVVFVATTSSADASDSAKPSPLKTYLVSVTLSQDQITPAAVPIDLTPYHYQAGAVITQINTDGTQAVLHFNRNDSADTAPVTFQLNHPVDSSSQ
ncbi:MAG: hypothetical protein ACREL1_04995 [bacterium]